MAIKKSRILSAFIALALTASFAGCGAQPAGKLGAESATSKEPSKISVPSPLEEPETSLCILSPGTDQGRYRTILLPQDYSSVLCYLDFSSGTETPLCSSPSCKHQDGNCPAWLREHNYVILNALDDEHLILMDSDLSSNRTTLSVANADGSDPRTLVEYPVSYAISPVFSLSFLADDEYIYYFPDTTSEIDDKTVSESPDYELFRVPLKGGTPEKMHNIKRAENSLIGTWGRDLILSRYELSPFMDEDQNTTTFLRHSLDTGEETPLLSEPVVGRSIASYFSQGNLYWIGNGQPDTLFWVDVNGKQNEMPLDWVGGTPDFKEDTHSSLKLTALVQNHLFLDVDGDHPRVYAIDLENGQVAPVTLTYLDPFSEQETPVAILQVVGSDLLVQCGSVNEQATHCNPDGTSFSVDNTTIQTGFISIDDYLAGKSNYQKFSMQASTG